MKTNEKKNTSAKKKLIPAVAMLTTSAVMLSTATYAWFTMSREVEVTGIKLTATTPQTIEISLGKAPESEATITTKTEAKAPGNTDADATLWSNKAATSSVYASFGKLIPVSSVDGYNMFYTTKATENGKKVDTTQDEPFTATTKESNAGWTFQTGGKSSATPSESGLTPDKEGEGYYLDIPVWFRTTSTKDVNLGVDVTLSNPDTAETAKNNVLYKATRVSILKSDKDTSDSRDNNAKVLFANSTDEAVYYNKTADDKGKAVASATKEYYGEAKLGNEVTASGGVVTSTNNTTVATVTKAEKTGYSEPVKYYIRVWLEGEDENCWNANAGQDFQVDLKFYDLSNTANGK
ncbi:hypothetical protein [uncultured Ruminococcus sp.]|uniref:hypothetical protein n=1 Tax=uncultured Ruminococcus sp. TaxID=165186 RepID=UPI0025F9B9B0|nr:hypothetical protein [uncultured Ruminococcus sp.]